MAVTMFTAAVAEHDGLRADVLYDDVAERYAVKLTDLDAGRVVGFLSFKHLCYWTAAQEAFEAVGLEDCALRGSITVL